MATTDSGTSLKDSIDFKPYVVRGGVQILRVGRQLKEPETGSNAGNGVP